MAAGNETSYKLMGSSQNELERCLRQYDAQPLRDIWSRFCNQLQPVLESEEDENKENMLPFCNKSRADNSSRSPVFIEHSSMSSRWPLSTLLKNSQDDIPEKENCKKRLFYVTQPPRFKIYDEEEDTKTFKIFEIDG